MLVLIGLGLYSEKDITLRGLEEARSSDYIFAEFYTSVMPGLNLDRLEKIIGRKVRLLSRSDIEEEGEKVILERAKKSKVSLLVAGDALISTTHVHLLLDARESEIEVRVVNNASIYSAAPSLAGLQNYKFGRSASIARPEERFFSETPYTTVKANMKMGLHTMLFLDIKVEKSGTYLMHAKEALEILLKLEDRKKEGVINTETIAVVVSRAGAPEFKLKAGSIRKLLEEDLGRPPHTLIIPAEFHFMEEEFLRAFASLSEE